MKLQDQDVWQTCTHIVPEKDRSKYSVSIASADAGPRSFTIKFSKDAGTATDVPPVEFQVENDRFT